MTASKANAQQSFDPCQIFDRFFTYIFLTIIPWIIKGTLDGNSPLSIPLFPIVLIYHSCTIYLIPCLRIYLKRFWHNGVMRLLCIPFGGFVRTDLTFYHIKDVLGEFSESEAKESLRKEGCDTHEEWYKTIQLVRFGDLNGNIVLSKKKKRQDDDDGDKNRNVVFLFKDGINATDVAQGALGDCWLLAAVAALAEFPDALRKIFIDREVNPRGMYTLRLFNAAKGRFETIQVDDRMPVKIDYENIVLQNSSKKKELLFLKASDNELWTALLQKAFAKFFGGYAQLDGGLAVVAWNILTGGNCMALDKEDGTWDFRIFKFGSKKSFGKSNNWVPKRVGASDVYYDWSRDSDFKKKSEDEVFDIIRAYAKSRCLLGASIKQKKDEEREAKHDNGLISGHAYSILDCRRPGLRGFDKIYDKGKTGVKLVKLRNPWGNNCEWKGAWSDGAKEWDENPQFVEELKYEGDKDDGVFWMDWKDFCENFTKIDVCDRDANKDLSLEIYEEYPKCGPCIGMASGCGKFWCKCAGCRVIYFGNEKGDALKSGNGCTKVCTAV